MKYTKVWPNIDVIVRESSSGKMKFHIDVNPGGNPAEALLRVYGLESAAIDDVTNDLVMKTAAGTITDEKPFLIMS
ncbi:DUF7948 domain-containing protein [Paenibacillus chartarius]|uniref:DUF7948 domain-containing protein n=1 Tax=Paenibacillus chartarius TaxID=747481 RepID=UPI00406BC978